MFTDLFTIVLSGKCYPCIPW